MKLFSAAIVGFVISIVFACSTPPILQPKTGPGTDYPCGVHGVVCPDNLCCDEGEACRPATWTIPIVTCETIDDGSGRLGAHKPHPAWKPQAR